MCTCWCGETLFNSILILTHFCIKWKLVHSWFHKRGYMHENLMFSYICHINALFRLFSYSIYHSWSMFLPPCKIQGQNKYIWHTKFEIRFSCVCPLVSNQMCTNFHYLKVSKYENNILLILHTTCFRVKQQTGASTIWERKGSMSSSKGVK